MPAYTEIIDTLVKSLTDFPGIGPKSAERMVFHLLKKNEAFSRELSNGILNVKNKICFCENCFNLSSDPICHICSNDSRQQSIICVVEEPKDLMAFEKAGGYNGVYHVLLGVISPLDGIGPNQLKIKELLNRIEQQQISEIILATNPNPDGDTTATYLINKLKGKSLRISKLSRGVPIGSNFEYIDQATLSCAIRDRREILQEN